MSSCLFLEPFAPEGSGSTSRDHLDEYVVQLKEVDGKKLKSTTKGGSDLGRRRGEERV